MRATITAAGVLLFAAASSAQVDRYGDPLPPGALARFGTARMSHGHVRDGGIAFRPDGRAVATWNTWSVMVWELPGGKRLWELSGGVSGVAFAPDGRSLAVAGKDGLHVVDAGTGRVTRTLIEASCAVPAFSPDGRTLAVVNRTRGDTLELWDVATGRLTTRLGYENLPLRTLAFAPDGRTLRATAFKQSRVESFVRVLRWDVATGASQPPFQPPGRADEHALSDDGRRLATRGDLKSVVLWDTATGKPTGEVEVGWGKFRFGPGGTRLVTCDYNQPGGIRVTVWDAATARREASFPAPRRDGEIAVPSPDGRTVATAGSGYLVCLWDAATGARNPDLPNHGRSVRSVRFTADGRTLVSNGYGVRIWDVTTTAQTGFIAAPDLLDDVASAVLPGGVVVSGAAGVGRFDLATGKPVGDPFAQPQLPPGLLPGDRFGVWQLAATPDGRSVVGSGGILMNRPGVAGSMPYLVVWDAATGKVTHAGPPPDGYSPSALSADGRTAFFRRYVHDAGTGEGGFDVRAVDTATWQTLSERRLPRWSTELLTTSDDGQSLAAAGVRTRAADVMDFQVFETRTFGVRTTFELAMDNRRQGLMSVTLSADGRLAALARWDGPIHVRDAVTGRELQAFAGGELPASSLAFSPDGQRLASGHVDGTLLLWPVAAPPQLPAADPEAAWTDLASDDARRANAASWSLVGNPAAAIALLAGRLKPSDAAAVRRARAIETLERIGTPDAAAVLRMLADGPAELRSTREAQDSLARLKRGAQ